MASRRPNSKRELNSSHKKLLTTQLRKLLRNRKVKAFLRSPKGMVVGIAAVVVLTFLGIAPNEYIDIFGSRPTSGPSTSAPRQGPYDLYGKVSHVADGDTINLYVNGEKQRIRLANIDAPENYGRSDRPGQPYADESTAALAAMVANKTLTLHCFEKDHYGRHVCNIPYNGTTANEALVAQGLAWAYTGSNERYLRDKNLKNVQAKAKAAGLGLWQQKNPIAPWTWRKDCWNTKYENSSSDVDNGVMAECLRAKGGK